MTLSLKDPMTDWRSALDTQWKMNFKMTLSNWRSALKIQLLNDAQL
jgi:hypothetical protein